MFLQVPMTKRDVRYIKNMQGQARATLKLQNCWRFCSFTVVDFFRCESSSQSVKGAKKIPVPSFLLELTEISGFKPFLECSSICCPSQSVSANFNRYTLF